MKRAGPDSTRGAVINYLSNKNVAVKSCFIIRKDDEKMSVKVSVDSADAHRLVERGFWPARVRCREWRV